MREAEPDELRAFEGRRFQFSLGALMVLVLAVAFALSAATSEATNWAYGLLAPVIVCIALGLVNQVFSASLTSSMAIKLPIPAKIEPDTRS